jgi:hypothetical protein
MYVGGGGMLGWRKQSTVGLVADGVAREAKLMAEDEGSE